jgi:16S rRNA (guanine527-N7)-methyltransferase
VSLAIRRAFERLLETDAGAAHLAPSLPPGFTDAAPRYAELLLDANAKLNLTRIVEPDAVARLHLLDAVTALPLVDEGAPSSAVDLGSGGGVPGMVLALARPRIRWLLIDSVARKADALRGFAAELGLGNVEVAAVRAEELGRDPAHREAHDLVTARACAALPVLAEYALPLLRVGGALVAWKGALSEAHDEVRAGAVASAQLGGGAPSVLASGMSSLPEHRFVVIRKERPTPERFPRRPGVPARRPLG